MSRGDHFWIPAVNLFAGNRWRGPHCCQVPLRRRLTALELEPTTYDQQRARALLTMGYREVDTKARRLRCGDTWLTVSVRVLRAFNQARRCREHARWEQVQARKTEATMTTHSYPVPTAADIAAATELHAQRWLPVSNKYRHVLRWAPGHEPPDLRDIIAPEHRDTYHGKRAADLLKRRGWDEDELRMAPRDMREERELTAEVYQALKTLRAGRA